jgi:hypothetical protein
MKTEKDLTKTDLRIKKQMLVLTKLEKKMFLILKKVHDLPTLNEVLKSSKVTEQNKKQLLIKVVILNTSFSEFIKGAEKMSNFLKTIKL